MSVHVLHLEDDALDASLVREALQRDGLECSIVHASDRPSFLAALRERPDIVLADYALPEFDGTTAQHLLRERWPDVPFVLVSGSLGEERAVEALRHGATDYVLKHRLQPLPSVVRRALKETKERLLRLRAEEDLKDLNAVLEERVRERTRDLERATAAIASREEELRRSEAFLSSVVEHLPDLLSVKDARSLEYVRCNRAVEQVLGRSRAEIVGRTDRDVFPTAEAQALTARDRAALQSRHAVDAREESIHTHDHGWRTFQTRRVPIADGTGAPSFLLGIARDITEERLAEHALKHARVEADRANRAKSEFLARMSHELRTPLNAVLGFAQLFRPEALCAEDAESVQQILHGGHHLLELITEVLDISRIEAGHLTVSTEAVDVGTVTLETLELIRPLAVARQVAVHAPDCPAPLFALSDRQRLKQILLNVCSNAVKYNNIGGDVRVSCERRGAGTIRVAIADTGPGIPAAKQSRLFTPFDRLGAERTGVEGTGLGLALSRRLAEAMDGGLSVDSRPGQGCTFFLDLPEASAPAPITAAPSEIAPRVPHIATSGQVLYIEDTQANVRLMQRLMARRPGVELLHAPDGRSGLRVFDEREPELVMLDLHLPDMSGEDVLQRIRARAGDRGPTIVILSADAAPSQRTRLLASGADIYLTKPLNVPEVLDLLDRTLGETVARAVDA